MPPDLVVGGLTPLSTVDWPGELAAVVFCQGCPWRCAYCHNPHLQTAGTEAAMSWEAVAAFLSGRRDMLDGVVFSGGEPTLQAGLPAALRAVRAMGFRTALHTAGCCPGRLAETLPFTDWIGLDIKAAFADYDRITGVRQSGRRARESLYRIAASGVDYEVRTTVHPALIDRDGLLRLAEDLGGAAVGRWVIQDFRPAGCPMAGLGPAAPLSEEVRGELRRAFPGLRMRTPGARAI